MQGESSAIADYAKAALIFPQKLHKMLEDVHQSGKTDIVSWHPRGESFVVHDEERFVRDILPRHLNQLKFTSFRRQLQYYGFTRDERETAIYGKRIFAHKKFVRRDPNLCLSMKSKRTPKLTKKQKEERAAHAVHAAHAAAVAAVAAARRDNRKGTAHTKTKKRKILKDASSNKIGNRAKQVDLLPNNQSSLWLSSASTKTARITNIAHVAPPEPITGGGHYYSDGYPYPPEDHPSHSGTENEGEEEDNSIDGEGNTRLPTQYALATSDGKRQKSLKSGSSSSPKRRHTQGYASQQERHDDNSTAFSHRLMIEPTLSSANTTITTTAFHPHDSYRGGGNAADTDDRTSYHRQEQLDDDNDNDSSSAGPIPKQGLSTKSTTAMPQGRRQYKKRKPKPVPNLREYTDFELNAPCLPYQQYRYNVIFHDLR